MFVVLLLLAGALWSRNPLQWKVLEAAVDNIVSQCDGREEILRRSTV